MFFRLAIASERTTFPNAMPDNFSNAWAEQSAALVIAHPGHELRIHHWLERARPVTFVLTDGSGHTDHSRIEFHHDRPRSCGRAAWRDLRGNVGS